MNEEWTQEKLDALLKEWQGVMRLRDWDIKIKMARARDMNGKEGTCRYTQSLKTAIISIMDPIDHPDDCEWPLDIEETIVHELVHIHFAPFSTDARPDELEHIVEEQAVESLAKALVEVKRQGVVLHGKDGYEADDEAR